MLLHSDQPLPTSLTRLGPQLAALSVVVYSQYVRAIERCMVSQPGVLLGKLAHLGRQHPPLRDEILLLLVKQMRHNMDVVATGRLWRCLSALLALFPPSSTLECYLESFLIQVRLELHTCLFIYSPLIKSGL
jgi:hypothetical protein